MGKQVSLKAERKSVNRHAAKSGLRFSRNGPKFAACVHLGGLCAAHRLHSPAPFNFQTLGAISMKSLLSYALLAALLAGFVAGCSDTSSSTIKTEKKTPGGTTTTKTTTEVEKSGSNPPPP
jgi:hypothetical protein